MLPDLNSLTSYRNFRVIEKFQRDYPHLSNQAEDVFVELMKYLWLSQKQRRDLQANPQERNFNFLLAIYDDMIPVDDMWHCFILNTREYEKFCHHYFGKFLHHIPDAMEDLPPTKEELAIDLEKFASYVYDNLGEQTVKTWFGLTA